MATDIDTSADELARGFATLLKASRAIPDLLETWRAFATLHADDRQRQIDAGADPDQLDPSAGDPMVFLVRANSIMVRAGVELGLKWQRLLSNSLPDIRCKLDAYRDDEARQFLKQAESWLEEELKNPFAARGARSHLRGVRERLKQQ